MWSPKGARTSRPTPMPPAPCEYLSSYLYRLVFNDNFSQAISSQVASDVGLTHAHNGRIPSVSLDRFETFASSTNGDEARILHLPSVRYDILDRPLSDSPSTGALAPRSATSAAPSPVSMPATWAASTSTRICPRPSMPAAGAWFPRAPFASPPTPSARFPI